MDVWWPREAAAKKEALSSADIQACPSQPLTVLAIDAPAMGRESIYDARSLRMLAMKVLLVFEVAEQLDSPAVLSGLLGCGAFRNNRPLILLLHLLLQPPEQKRNLIFHNPIFWSFCSLSNEQLEERILKEADNLLQMLRDSGVQTLENALEILFAAGLPLSNYDEDLISGVASSRQAFASEPHTVAEKAEVGEEEMGNVEKEKSDEQQQNEQEERVGTEEEHLERRQPFSIEPKKQTPEPVGPRVWMPRGQRSCSATPLHEVSAGPEVDMDKEETEEAKSEAKQIQGVVVNAVASADAIVMPPDAPRRNGN